jgi:hypothetical protein
VHASEIVMEDSRETYEERERESKINVPFLIKGRRYAINSG